MPIPEGYFHLNTRLPALLSRGATVNDGVAAGIRVGAHSFPTGTGEQA